MNGSALGSEKGGDGPEKYGITRRGKKKRLVLKGKAGKWIWCARAGESVVLKGGP